MSNYLKWESGPHSFSKKYRKEMSRKDNMPVLRVVRLWESRSKEFWQVEVWCPFCARTHHHGVKRDDFPVGQMESRVSHCGLTGDDIPRPQEYWIYNDGTALKP